VKEKREGFWILPSSPTARHPLRADTPEAPADLRRVVAFRRQLDEWTASGRIGAPVFGLPGVPVAEGQCVGCGETLAQGRAWRCPQCVRAVEQTLGLSPLEEPEL
jgi:hypothetical protein